MITLLRFRRLLWLAHRQARRTRHETLILGALWRAGELPGFSLMEQTGLGSGALYPALARLERGGWVVGRWDTDSCPRRRWYSLTRPGRAQVDAVTRSGQ